MAEFIVSKISGLHTDPKRFTNLNDTSNSHNLSCHSVFIDDMLSRFLGIFAFVPFILFVAAYPANFDENYAEEVEHEFQGDMIISQQELDAFNGRIDERLRWPGNTVPYYVDPTFFSKLRVIIL